MQVKIDLDGVKRKLSKTNMQRGQYSLANQALADMNQYVPMDQGHLRMASSVNAEGTDINYTSPYAAKQFYEQASNYTTPGTGPRWDEKAKGIHMKDWEKAFTEGAGL